MKKLLFTIWSKFLDIFGSIKIFKWPLFIVYDPYFYKMTGNKVLDVISLIKPGDVIMRGYDGYLDGKFVPSETGYSHAGIYVGDNTIIHAVSPNVTSINIIDFCQCDRIAIVRPVEYKELAIQRAREFLAKKIPYDYLFNRGSSSLYCFELASTCYKELDIKEKKKSSLFGLIKKSVVLSDSFFESADFETVFEYNPKYKKDYKK